VGPRTPDGRSRRHGWLRLMEGIAWAAAVLLGGTWATARGLAAIEERRSLAAFEHAGRDAVDAPEPSAGSGSGGGHAPKVDQRLWDPAKIKAYARTLSRPAPPPLAVLRIPRLGLEVPVLEGTDEWTLDRAVGHIEGTPGPGHAGNVGIAGHRDSYFRVLKDIAQGDVLELALRDGVRHFRVARVSIVGPDDVSVLAPTRGNLVTLVTCYPFYYVGAAPQRFIVHAAEEGVRPATARAAR
jgi:sortase A